MAKIKMWLIKVISKHFFCNELLTNEVTTKRWFRTEGNPHFRPVYSFGQELIKIYKETYRANALINLPLNIESNSNKTQIIPIDTNRELNYSI